MLNFENTLCDQCTDNSTCYEKLDAHCAIYHITLPGYTPPPSRLLNLGLPNNTPVDTILDAIDAAFGQIGSAGGITVNNTPAINIAVTGVSKRILTPTLVLSQSSGNTAVINSDGLFVPSGMGKVQVDPWHSAYFLEDALIGGSGDNIVAISFEAENGFLIGLPTVNLPNLVQGIINDSTLIQELTNSVVNAIINNPTFLSELTTAIEQQILNDPSFITELTQAIVNNPSSEAILCQQIAACQSGSTGCSAPLVTGADFEIASSGGTGTLTVTYNNASPVPADGYIIYYREVGSSGAYSSESGITSSPITINGLTPSDYEGYLISNCGGGSFSSGSTFTTSGDYYNVDTTNDLTAMTIQSVTGIPGYTLHGPVPVSGSDTGLHGAFTGAIAMTLSGTAGINGSAFLIVNGNVISSQTINSGTSPSVINFPSHTYAAGDLIQTGLNS